MRDPVRLPRLAIALTILAVTLAGTAALGDYFLHAFGGVFIYLPASAVLNVSGFTLALATLLAGTESAGPASRPSPWGMGFSIVGVAALAVCSVVLLPFATNAVVNKLYHSDPIGVGDDVARGPCRSRTVASRRNANGLVADVRETSCLGNWDGDLMYFVFVHGAGGQDTKQTLLFRYKDDTFGTEQPPVAIWKSPSKLAVVGHWNVTDVTYQLHDTKDISVVYD